MKEKSSKILSYKNFLGAKFTPGKDEVESKIKGAAKGLKSCRLSTPGALCTASHLKIVYTSFSLSHCAGGVHGLGLNADTEGFQPGAAISPH